MDPTIVQYALFVLAALLIIGAVVALNRWLYRQNKPASASPHTWAKLDTRHSEARDEAFAGPLFEDEDEDEDDDEAEMRVRARQNGHSSNGHKPLN
ncbi:MAG TPA: hypothetical protein VHD63_03235 [Ktedonobacteraceae bacterium]|jgi:hypothetical protein|nr:hypothetical protein [Ktedonobacteraceae bacterium]